MAASSRRADVLWILYDGACNFCKVCVALLLLWDRSNLLTPIAIQDAEGQAALSSIPTEDRLSSAHVVTSDRQVLSGADGAPTMLRRLPGGGPLAALFTVGMPVARLGYRLLTLIRPILGSILPARSCNWATEVIHERRCGTTLPTARL
jgi:predicted DCC family thiol-disulfide oxidoreductase YuxK